MSSCHSFLVVKNRNHIWPIVIWNKRSVWSSLVYRLSPQQIVVVSLCSIYFCRNLHSSWSISASVLLTCCPTARLFGINLLTHPSKQSIFVFVWCNFGFFEPYLAVITKLVLHCLNTNASSWVSLCLEILWTLKLLNHKWLSFLILRMDLCIEVILMPWYFISNSLQVPSHLWSVDPDARVSRYWPVEVPNSNLIRWRSFLWHESLWSIYNHSWICPMYFLPNTVAFSRYNLLTLSWIAPHSHLTTWIVHYDSWTNNPIASHWRGALAEICCAISLVSACIQIQHSCRNHIHLLFLACLLLSSLGLWLYNCIPTRLGAD